jgi:hypothetical protein
MNLFFLIFTFEENLNKNLVKGYINKIKKIEWIKFGFKIYK